MRSPAVGTPTISMPTASANSYQPLGDYLTQRWQQMAKEALVIRCASRGGRLLVLVEHVIAVQPNLTATFERIKDLLEAAPPEVWTAQSDLKDPPGQLGVNMFIRVINQKQSYGECEWDIVPLKQFLGDSRAIAPAASSSALARIPAVPTPAIAGMDSPLLEAGDQDAALAGETDLDGDLEAALDLDLDADDTLDWSGEVAIDPEMAAAFSPEHLRLEPLPGAERDAAPNVRQPAPSATGSANSRGGAFEADASGQGHFGHDDSEHYNSEHYNSEHDDFEHDDSDHDSGQFEPDDSEDRARVPIHIPRSVWAAGLGLCLLTFAASFYVASRPCWFRSCAPLALAQQQGEDVNSMLQVASTWDDLEKARLALNDALGELRNVPVWTSYGPQARGLRDRYQRTIKSLTPIQDALKQAELAQDKGQGSQLRAKQLQEIQVYWEAAIAQLKGVSPQSPMYALAQDKLSQYEKNLSLAQARLEEETRGQELLRKARAIASDLPNKSDGLDALTFLQRSQIKLQDALYTLRQVPRTTTAYQEAVPLISRYESELSINQGQQSKEGFIVNTYQEALASAEAAKVSESQNHWEDARDHWQAALASINQVPESSSAYFPKAQGLIPEYTYALQQAEQKAQQFAKLQDVERDLAKVCQGTPLICTYEATPQLLAVTLTLDYERAVLTAGSVGDEQSRIGALNHVHALETALEEVSNAAQIPLELYDPDGVMVGTHQPRGTLGAV